MEETIANSIDTVQENVQDTNSQDTTQGTQENENSTNETTEGEQSVDYKKKFSESSTEALRLYEENKKLKEELELKANGNSHEEIPDTGNLYPGFDTLDEESKKNIISFSDAISKKAAENLRKDPAYAFSLRQYSENKYNTALEKTILKYPELASFKDEFKFKTYNPAVVPDNIENILDDLAKIHLFDKAKEIGAKEATEKTLRVDLERNSVGQKDTTTKRSLEDWSRMASENPMKFASLSKEYEADVKSGKI